MNIAIIGAGLTGLAAADQLSGGGRKVVVFERSDGVGGLARGFEICGKPIERYYHHLFTHDTTFMDYAQELGLAGEIDWLPSSMATFIGGRLYPFMGPKDLLAFPALPFLERIRFGMAVLYARRMRDYARLESLPASLWLPELFGEAGYKVVWEPLLRKKFERHSDDVSAVWMWGKIALRGSSRAKGKEKEYLGYMRGGFQRFHEALARRCRNRGADIRLGSDVAALAREGGGWTLAVNGVTHGCFDQVLITIHPGAMRNLVAPFLTIDEASRLERLKYQGAIVAVLRLGRRLTPYYWTNVHDHDIPFGGIIEHTNLLPPESYGNSHIVYLSRYISPEDPLFQAPDDDVLERFQAELPKFNASFEPGWVQDAWVFRDVYAQPVVVCDYPRHAPPMETSAPGLFLANMSHIYPEDRGMNYALALGRKVAARMAEQGTAQVWAWQPALT